MKLDYPSGGKVVDANTSFETKLQNVSTATSYPLSTTIVPGPNCFVF